MSVFGKREVSTGNEIYMFLLYAEEMCMIWKDSNFC